MNGNKHHIKARFPTLYTNLTMHSYKLFIVLFKASLSWTIIAQTKQYMGGHVMNVLRIFTFLQELNNTLAKIMLVPLSIVPHRLIIIIIILYVVFMRPFRKLFYNKKQVL